MKISYSLRAFGIYFVILGSLIWFTLDNAIERLNDGMRQSAESVLVDVAQILATFIEDEAIQNDRLSTIQLKRVFEQLGFRKFSAQIYQVTKTDVDSEVYVTDQNGIIIYDSTGENIGEDYSKWRDVRLTLDGKYGARTSYTSQLKTEPEDPKVMIIAAPITHQGNTIGVVSVLKPIDSLEGHLLTETKQLQNYAFVLLALALLLGYLLSLWFTHSLNKLATYANNVAEGRKVTPPIMRDVRLAELSNSISYMRSQLDGKEYVENYIHSLTHELKTPITSIRCAVELMSEDMPAEDRGHFLNNINTSNQRMSRLVDRMLSLAKLESTTELLNTEEFDLAATIKRLVQERSPTISERELKINLPQQTNFSCSGDRVLIGQAVANLLDNAIRFCHSGGQIDISIESLNGRTRVSIFNQGEAIPSFALAKLYDRFYSLPPSNNNQPVSKSTGLGLSFVKEIMKLHKGRIEIKNIPNGVLATLRW
ncbi:MAG: two-component system sensor histidine kinase CreC [Arenicella sp.]|nr:two-component system sensor histidine kinase CreC [Arenicella sp.]